MINYLLLNLKKTLLFIFLFLNAVAYSQNSNRTIQGKVQDMSSEVALVNTSVVLLNSNSFIISDTRTSIDGTFKFKKVDTGNYVLLFTRHGYVDFSKKINIGNYSKNILDQDIIKLYKKEILLNEIVIRAKVSAIKIIGDTIQYQADSIKLAPNASVEDLLRQLPNIQIDEKGKIMAHGKEVRKVLVDGEEFFGNDPLLTTRNLRADMIDKVQLYDKKSDAAVFTGIDDGVKDKTINLKLKESKKHGYFGRATAGAGNKDFYNLQGMVNLFQTKRRISAYITSGNIGQSGLAKEDNERIGNDDEGSGNYDGKGIPRITSAGVHYDDKWNNDKTSINANGKITISDVNKVSSTITNYILPGQEQQINTFSTNDNNEINNKYNFNYKTNFSNNSIIRVFADINYLKRKSTDNLFSSTENANELVLNSLETKSSENQFKNLNFNLEWQKRFKKVGRTLSAYLNTNFQKINTNGSARFENSFFNLSGGIDSVSNLQLIKSFITNNRTTSLNTIYTEAISKNINVSFSHNLVSNESDDDRRSFDDIQLQAQNSRFSAHLLNSYLINKGGLNLSYGGQKLSVNISGSYGHQNLQIEDDNLFSKLKKDYILFEPRLKINFKFTDYRFLELSYFGNRNSPTYNQLLPSRSNNSLTSVFLPNSFLRSSHSDGFNLNLVRFDVSTESSWNIAASFEQVSDPITLTSVTSPSGIFTYQYKNLFDKRNQTISISVLQSLKIRALDGRFSSGFAYFRNNIFNETNSTVNKLALNNYNFSFSFNKAKEKKYQFDLNTLLAYNTNNFSLNQVDNNDYFSISTKFDIDVYIRSIKVHSDFNYQWLQKTSLTNRSFNRVIWNSWIGKYFFKGQPLLFKVACNDILNQNVGLSRVATSNYFTQNTFNTLQRFFLFSAVWNFNKFN
ncbi:Carboxypeptidase regulatory-like domain-containing protein [Pedobacter terrae]|uniref:Carboxypeptidase regulatory-like domain-containing protein n=1 Tax=Pedobacter terrae TaxID=405671 RepID=A0A1G8CJU3_9SPHI|nr:outer membrane beta-barrel protein [Pedobacter terrae]SDH45726.1 Carboxypeptidase regulatory-like domain-containing protein [Pedobacter terrae]